MNQCFPLKTLRRIEFCRERAITRKQEGVATRARFNYARGVNTGQVVESVPEFEVSGEGLTAREGAHADVTLIRLLRVCASSSRRFTQHLLWLLTGLH